MSEKPLMTCERIRHGWLFSKFADEYKEMNAFGEHVAARKFPYMVKEIFLKAALYNMFNRMT